MASSSCGPNLQATGQGARSLAFVFPETLFTGHVPGSWTINAMTPSPSQDVHLTLGLSGMDRDAPGKFVLYLGAGDKDSLLKSGCHAFHV